MLALTNPEVSLAGSVSGGSFDLIDSIGRTGLPFDGRSGSATPSSELSVAPSNISRLGCICVYTGDVMLTLSLKLPTDSMFPALSPSLSFLPL